MPSSWVTEEMKDVALNDKRLNERLTSVLKQLGERPTASIPAACGGYAETTAAYRLFDNDKVTFDKVLQPHIDSTRRRIAEQPVVILAQDTTEVDLTRPEQQVAGAGPLGQGSRLGMFLHSLSAFTPDGTPLGTVHAKVWARDTKPLPPKSERKAKRQHTPIEKKESWRWVNALRQSREEARLAPQTRFLCVADSEADIYELFSEAEVESEPQNIEWIVRACQNRALREEKEQSAEGEILDAQAKHMREQVLAGDVLLTYTINVRGRKAKVDCCTRGRQQPRESRTAEVEVRAARVTLRAPWRHDRKLSHLTLNVVLVQEVDPPANETPVEWLLLTNMAIDTADQVREVIRAYCVRWMIEIYFRTLKSGCRVEERRFEHADRLKRCLAVYMIVAWRTLYVCRLGRAFPDISCEAIFEPAEWKSVYQVVHRISPPSTPPTLREMVRLVAQLGGYVNRRRRDEPGPQTLWLGLQRLHDIALCWKLFGPKAESERALV